MAESFTITKRAAELELAKTVLASRWRDLTAEVQGFSSDSSAKLNEAASEVANSLSMSEQVRRHPWEMTGGALVLGILASRLIGRSPAGMVAKPFLPSEALLSAAAIGAAKFFPEVASFVRAQFTNGERKDETSQQVSSIREAQGARAPNMGIVGHRTSNRPNPSQLSNLFEHLTGEYARPMLTAFIERTAQRAAHAVFGKESREDDRAAVEPRRSIHNGESIANS